jgi:hypothetical protein
MAPHCSVNKEEAICMSETTAVTQGELIAFTTGEYSDYCFNGLWRALKDCDLSELGAAYLNERPDQRHDYSFEREQFYAWLVAQGYFEYVPVREFHAGSYSCWRPSMSKHADPTE